MAKIPDYVTEYLDHYRLAIYAGEGIEEAKQRLLRSIRRAIDDAVLPPWKRQYLDAYLGPSRG